MVTQSNYPTNPGYSPLCDFRISRCEVYSIGDLYQDDTIFIGFPRTESELLMCQFTLHPKGNRSNILVCE